MKNPPFTYHRPASLGEALALLADIGDDAKVLAGGQSLLPIMALRLGPPEHIVDIGLLADLDGVSVDDGAVTIGALVRHAEAEVSTDIRTHAPMIHAAMPYVGHRAIRTRGTVVGSIAHADPAAEMPAVCLATEATMTASSTQGERSIAAGDFFDGYLTTTLRPDEILTSVTFPATPPTTGATVAELARRHGDYALVGLACSVDIDGGTISGAALSFFGAASVPVRVPEAEAMLIGRTPDAASFTAAAEVVSATLTPGADLHGSATYRRHIAGVLTRHGLAKATAQIGVPV